MSEMASVLAMLNELKQKLEARDALLDKLQAATLKKTDKSKKAEKSKKADKSTESDNDEKPKRALNEGIKAWHVFLKRVRALMVEMDMGFSIPTEITQFCSALKAKNGDYESWSNEDILEERENWQKPEKSKQEIAGKNSKKTSAASSVAEPKKKALPVSDAEDCVSDSDDEPEPVKKVVEEVKKVVEEKAKKSPGRPKKVVEETPKETPKKAGRPKKAKEPEDDENRKYELEGFKHLGKMYTKTDHHDVIDEDNGVYVGRWNEDTNQIDKTFPQPAYVKKMIAEMDSDDE
jgi:hypothetical protein